MNGGVINTLWLVNHYRKPVFGAKLYSPDTTIVTPNANLAVSHFYLFIFCERRASSVEGIKECPEWSTLRNYSGKSEVFITCRMSKPKLFIYTLLTCCQRNYVLFA